MSKWKNLISRSSTVIKFRGITSDKHRVIPLSINGRNGAYSCVNGARHETSYYAVYISNETKAEQELERIKDVFHAKDPYCFFVPFSYPRGPGWNSNKYSTTKNSNLINLKNLGNLRKPRQLFDAWKLPLDEISLICNDSLSVSSDI